MQVFHVKPFEDMNILCLESHLNQEEIARKYSIKLIV